ncbi:gametocyte-specific factor 1 isoform X1 [Astyanax mexicanus]|uniref:gametocyte-specific factor 1 isoform X1 n=2 Tax=Astyanax mexicanus TaxID=7994 RepID=UPI0020CB613B|nr:gametocyte-specific factor 1 isoform X1 [Astyanax mexicanus]XP_022532555.2 gametocyte-specific factor 1 isoform X1 [Astyanax mexicanus]XP_049319188.1 gametocyte-specific factor 1 isoform X1 [Astyanax mexicanus]
MSSTIRFGSSLGPRAVHSTAELLNGEVPEKPDDPSDPNKMLQCPYDKNHQIRASRFPYHILKCRKNHPKLAEELKTCPFNAKHLMPKHELSHHIENCEDRCSITIEGESTTERLQKFQVPVSTWTNPTSTEEDWDKEADDHAATFVWGVSTNVLSQNKPEPSTTNSLTPGLRAPRTLPWKLWFDLPAVVASVRVTASLQNCDLKLPLNVE